VQPLTAPPLSSALIADYPAAVRLRGLMPAPAVTGDAVLIVRHPALAVTHDPAAGTAPSVSVTPAAAFPAAAAAAPGMDTPVAVSPIPERHYRPPPLV